MLQNNNVDFNFQGDMVIVKVHQDFEDDIIEFIDTLITKNYKLCVVKSGKFTRGLMSRLIAHKMLLSYAEFLFNFEKHPKETVKVMYDVIVSKQIKILEVFGNNFSSDHEIFKWMKGSSQ